MDGFGWALPALWGTLGVTVVVCGLVAPRRRLAYRLGLLATSALWMLAGAGVNALLLARGEDYSGFAAGSWLPFVRRTWDSLVVPYHAFFVGLLIVGEAAAGLLVLGKGKARLAALWSLVGFNALLVLFGWGFLIWSVPVSAGLVGLIVASRPAHRPAGAGRAVVWLLRSIFGPLVDEHMTALRYVANDGRVVTLPVQYGANGSRLEVAVAHPDGKTWWRHFRRPEPVEALMEGHWVPATGVVLSGGARAAAVAEVVTSHRALATRERFEVVEIDLPSQARAPLRGLALWRVWTPLVALGELLGFAAPLLVGVLYGGWWPAMLVAGAVEGAVLGSAQAAVLAHVLPGLRRRRWVLLTSLGAVLAYAAAFLGVHTADVASGASRIVVPVICGAVVLVSLGSTQVLELDHHLRRAGRWVAITAGAWMVALGVFLAIATPLWHEGQAATAAVAVGVAAAAAMAYAQAALTGWGLCRLLRR